MKRNVTFLILIASVLLFAHPIVGQVKKRVILFPESYSSSDDTMNQLEIVEIKVAGKPVTINESFEADENWLKNITILIKNVDEKSIVAFTISGGLLEGLDEELSLYESYRYGIGWDLRKSANHTKKNGHILNPEQIVELSFSNINAIYRSVLDRDEWGKFCKLKLKGLSIYYKDGTESDAHIKFHANKKP